MGFLTQLAKAQTKSEPDCQRVETKKADDGKRAHRDKSKPRQKACPSNDRHDNGKGARAKRAAGGQGGIKIGLVEDVLHLLIMPKAGPDNQA